MITERNNPNGTFGTHVHPLLASALSTKGTIIEFGTGDFSTLVLHEVCKHQNRRLISYDDHEEWHNNFVDLKSDIHEFTLVKDWNDVPVIKCGLVFIDHAPAERRVIDIDRFANHAEIIVVHDTDKMDYYGYQSHFDQFKYVYTYKRFKKTTTLLSNTIDVSELCA